MKPSRRIALVGSIVLVTAAWPSIAQHPPIDAKVTVNKTIAGAVAYSNPALQVSGTIEATAGHRLYIVEIAVGASDVAGELAAFPLVIEGGREVVAIAAGGGGDLLFPIEKIAIGASARKIGTTRSRLGNAANNSAAGAASTRK